MDERFEGLDDDVVKNRKLISREGREGPVHSSYKSALNNARENAPQPGACEQESVETAPCTATVEFEVAQMFQSKIF